MVARGLRLHARTACPSWLGERLDVGWAIDVLDPAAANDVNGNLAGTIGPGDLLAQ